MAHIVFSVQEVIDVLRANDKLPKKIKSIEPAEGGVSLAIATGMIFPASVKAQIKFAEFRDDRAVFELVLGGMMEKLGPMISQMVQSIELPESMELDFPRILIDVNALIERKVRGARVRGVEFDEGVFKIEVEATAG